ncbi:hypothetical protein K458DRAFT_490535 [Lentithecium fluviatile CBS 122367]|uniref:Uncharacterized protein n=1 Tax=Lentithecium fluviatile CBS 122367 TaxID=1168545 RepID=A0A6G1IMQ2_9PLEO|nr:hypothetical protein K458DRAFT_490535 [Lentithecium fluviatile CBS 122367]
MDPTLGISKAIMSRATILTLASVRDCPCFKAMDFGYREFKFWYGGRYGHCERFGIHETENKSQESYRVIGRHILDPDYVGSEVAKEAAEIYYSKNSFWVFLNKILPILLSEHPFGMDVRLHDLLEFDNILEAIWMPMFKMKQAGSKVIIYHQGLDCAFSPISEYFERDAVARSQRLGDEAYDPDQSYISHKLADAEFEKRIKGQWPSTLANLLERDDEYF